MWKKLGVVLVSLIATFSVVYAMNQDMNAASGYTAGGNVTGRVNKAPSNLTLATGAKNIGMQKGDKVFVGTVNPSTNKPLGWLLIQDQDKYYGTTTKAAGTNISAGSTSTIYPKYNVVNDTVAHSAWFTMSTESIGSVSVRDNLKSVNPSWGFSITGGSVYYIADYCKSTIYNTMAAFNSKIPSIKGYDLIEYRYLDALKELQGRSYNTTSYVTRASVDMVVRVVSEMGRVAFFPDPYTIYSTSFSNGVADPTKGFGFNRKVANPDVAFNSIMPSYYFIEDMIGNIQPNGSHTQVKMSATLQNIRPGLMLNLDTVVFGLSQGTSDSVATVKEPKVPASYSSLYASVSGDSNMKLRVLDNNMSASITDLRGAGGNVLQVNNSKSEIASGKTININASANSLNNSVVSVLLFDTKGSIAYYRPLEPAKGTGTYAFDTTGIPVGEYQLAIVNEEYDDTSYDIMYSSLISDVVPLRIVNEHTISYVATPQGGQTTYEYTKNVKADEKIGTLSRTNGVVPITYRLISDGDDTYKNFEIDGLDASGASSDLSFDVKVKSSGAPDLISSTNSLKAGTYKFCIESVDANGDPTTQETGKSKVCVSLTVDKTIPTITFSDTTNKYMKIGDSTFTHTITTSNKDTLNTADVTYAITGGVSGVLTPTTSTSDPLTFDVNIVGSHGGTGLPATFDLNASIIETENYLAASTSTPRKIIAYKELSALAWSPSKGSYSSTDVTTGSVVGTLLASDGVGPYTYEVVKSTDTSFDPVKGKDNASFAVSSTGVASGTKVDVKTASNLAIGTYNMQFKVTDASGGSFYTFASIKVDAMAQASVDFKDAPSGTVITTIGQKVKFDDTSAKLIAEGGSTGKPMEYELAPAGMQPSGVTNPSSIATVNKTSGLITPVNVGTIKVQAKCPGDTSYGDAIVYMDLTIEPAPQKIDFNITTSPVGIEQGKSALVDAKGQLISTGTTGVGDITYAIDNTAIATVDASGNVTGVSNGTATLTATLNDPVGSNYDPNYETVTATKSISIYTGMTLTWTEKTPHLLAEANKAGDSVGTINVADNQGAITYAISTASTTQNADASFFQVTGSGTSATLEIKTPITAADQASHGGSFKVQVVVTDTKGTRTIDIVVQIDEATNTIYFTDAGSKITSLSKVFGESGNSFTLTSYSTNSGSATYSDDGAGVITVLGTGITTINKVGTSTVSVVIGSGSGYAGGTTTMVVTITPGNQAIAFQDTTTLNQKFVAGTTFSEVADLTETSANTASTRTITYTSNTPSVCTIDAAGTVTMVSKGICDIDASNSDSDWKAVTTNKKINLYDGMGVSFAQTSNLQAGTVNTAANAPAGSLTVSGGSGTKTYAISTNTGADNLDASLFKVNSSGVVSFTKAIVASDLAGKYDPVKKVYVLHVQVDTTDSLSNTVTTNAVVEIKGEKLNAQFETGGIGKIVEEYGLGKTFTLSLSSNAGGGVPAYQLKADPTMPTDVLQSVDPSGLVTILHANDSAANPNPVMVEAVIPANNGYDEETIEVEVEIVKASQPAFAFKNNVVKLGYEAQVTPIFVEQLTTGPIVLTSNNNAIASIVSGTDIKANSTDGSATITAIAPGDRDYKSATATATVNVSSAPAYSLILSVPSATYGDTGLSASIVLNGASGAILTQAWSSSDPSIADIDASGNITIYKAGTITISYTQTSVGEPSVTSTVTMVIAPKPITVTINDASKYVGEAMPSFTANIPTADLVGTDTIGQPTFSCNDGTTPVTPDTKAGTYDITGAYPTGSYPDYKITVKKGTLTVKQDASLASWFHLEGDTSKTKLDPSKWHNQDVNVVLDSAVESAGTYNEISLNKTLWDKTSIKVTNEGENIESVTFRIDASDPTHPLAMSSSQPTTIKIDKTKPVIKSITGTATNKDAISSLLNKLTFGKYFKPGTKVSIQSEDLLPKPNTKVSGVKSVAYEVFEIDRTTGKIGTTPIARGDITPNASGISEVTMNDAGLYRVCAIPSDHAGNVGTISCSDLNVKNIGVDIDKDGKPDNLDPDGDGCPDIDIVLKDEEDKFFKLNVDRDGDHLPDLNIDSDGDGKADINVDTDGDGKPDVNLLIVTKEMWKPTFCVTGQSDEYCTVKELKPTINVDLDGDNIPDINIDTNGDMMADYNITRSGETKPYLNIGTSHTKWDPKHDFAKDAFGYDTDGTCKPLLNIDSDNDGLPDLNIDLDDDGLPDLNIDLDLDNIPDVDIDSDGDGIPDINLDPDKTGKPTKNIIEIKEWKPEHNVDGDVPYDTMVIEKKDELEDKNVTVEKPDGGLFLPNYAIKVDKVTDSIQQNEKDKINEYAKDGIEIKEIFDVKMYEGSTQVEPDGIIKVKIPLDAKYQNSKTVKVIAQQKDGTYKEIDVRVENGFIVYETDYLGTISILADIEEEETPKETPKVETPTTQKPITSVKGNYTSSVGGAITGDPTNLLSVLGLFALSAITGVIIVAKIRNKDDEKS